MSEHNCLVSKEPNQYFCEIDIARAIGIFLVVLGHSFPDASLPGKVQMPIWRDIFLLIYSFHMPLFIFISGFVSSGYKVSLKAKKEAIKKKTIRLMIPYLVWGVIYIPFRIVLSTYSSADFQLSNLWRIIIGKNPYSGLWFLYALYTISIIYIILVDTKEKQTGLTIASLLLLILSKTIEVVEPINWICAYLFYYMCGSFVRNYYEKIANRITPYYSQIISLVVFLCSYFFVRQSVTNISEYLGIITALSGICFTMSTCALLKRNRTLEYIGKYGMDIFILSGPILVVLRIVLYTKLHMNYNFYVVLATIIGYIFPILITSQVIRRSRVLSLLLLGDVKGKWTQSKKG